jgi:hypothetical protein
MNRKKNSRRRKNEGKVQKKVIRCKKFNRPVFNVDTCSDFAVKLNSGDSKNCSNCIHAF